MPLKRPTLTQLTQRARADVSHDLGPGANLRTAPEVVLAVAVAGLAHDLHGHLRWLSRQLLVDSAEEEFLLRHAGNRKLEQVPAVAATGNATATGAAGSTIPAGTLWQRGDGARYKQADAATVGGGGSVVIALTAVDRGAAGNADPATALTIATPVAGVDSTATVDGNGLTNGVDLETVEELRQRTLYNLQHPPSGGGPGDYVRWALEVAGVTRAWEYPSMMGVGTVGVRFVCDNQAGSIIPNGAKVAAVAAHIATKAPISTSLGQVYVLAPTAKTVDVTISDVAPDTAAVRAAVEASLAELFAEQAPGGTVYLSKINEAISSASGEEDHVLATPAANVTCATGEIAVLGAVTWS